MMLHLGLALRKAFVPVFSLIIVLAFILAACGGGSQSNNTSSKYNGNISVGVDSDIVTLDPLKSTALVDRQVMLNIYDTLVRVDEHNNIQPDLATSWAYSSSDNTKLVFTLRTGVTFTDGTPFNADAVVFNIERILTTPTSPRASELATVQSVQALDPTHVQFNLKKPFAPLLANLTDRAGMILSPTAVKKIGEANLGNAPVNAGYGSGSCYMATWVSLFNCNNRCWILSFSDFPLLPK